MIAMADLDLINKAILKSTRELHGREKPLWVLEASGAPEVHPCER